MLKGNGGRTKRKTKGPIKRKARSHSSSHKGGSQRRKMSKRKKTRLGVRKRKEKVGGVQCMSPCVGRRQKAKKRDHDSHTYQVGCHIWGNEC